MRRGIVIAVILLSLLIPAGIISCDATQLPEAESLIGPDGGVVEVTDPESEIYGFRFTIPEGALDEETLITVKVVDEAPSLLYEYQTSPCIEIGPSGTQFAVNCTISFPYDESMLNDYTPEANLSIISYNASCECWRPTDGTVVDAMNNVIHGEVQHLSLFEISPLMTLSWYSEGSVGMTKHESAYPPVLFVHGFCPPLGAWGSYLSTFGATMSVLQGLFSERPVNERLDIWGVSYYTGDYIQYSAGLLSDAINIIKQETGEDKVVVIAHSMGGLVTRAYVQGMAIDKAENLPTYYGNDISKILFAGTPHHGTRIALIPALLGALFGTPAASQMLPSSAFLNNLNDKSEHPIPNELLVHNLLGYYDYPGDDDDGDGIVTYESQKLLPEYGDGDLTYIKVTTLVNYHHIRGGLFNWEYGEVDVALDQIDHHKGLETMTEFILEVIFPDPNLEAAIREELGKPAGEDIYPSDLEELTFVKFNVMNIVDLTGMEYCTGLTHLELQDNQISDLSPLSSLTNLTTLYINSNQISDLSPLENLTNLTRLTLYNNQISDIQPLSSLTNLTFLNIQSNQISDIQPLSSLTNLTYLSLMFNHLLSDIQGLSSLTSLTKLFISDTQVTDLSPLSNLTNLTLLWAFYTGLSDISPLVNLTSLTWINLGQNQISNIQPLSNLTNLTKLDLYNNQISDMSALIGNPGLGEEDRVDIRSNPLSSDSINIYIPQLQARGVTVWY